MSADVNQHSGAAPGGPLSGVAVYTMFAGDPEQLAQWCNYHLNAGADQLYVVLDSPSPELVASLPPVDRVQWHPVDRETWDRYYPRGSQNVERKQVDAFRWIASLAWREGHRFLAFVDSDELLRLTEPFGSLADRSPESGAFAVSVREMWLGSEDPEAAPFGATLALSPSSAREVSWKRAFGWRAQFLRSGLMGHDSGKTIYRLPLAAGDLSVHRPRSGPLAATLVELPPASCALLHFDGGSVTTWNRRWVGRLRGSTVAAGLAPHRAAQQGLFAHVLRQAADEQVEFFRRFYSLDGDAQELLRGAGVLTRIDVSPELSGPVALPVSTGSQLGRLPEVDQRVDFQFAMVCDKRFVRPTFATMISVLSQIGDQGSVRFVVLGDGLDPADAMRLRSLEHTRYDVRVSVHDITSDLDRDIGTEDPKRATFGRIYLIDYLPPQRTVYLDGDVLATRDFSELFRLDLQGACLAGAPDSAARRLVANPSNVPIQQRTRLLGITHGDPLEYLNGGVLIFDLDNPDFRGLALEARMLVVMRGGTLKQRDQDAMNMAFAGRKYRLPSTYNYMTQFFVSDRCLDGDLIRLKYDAADAALIHFSGKIKPWESPEEEFYNGLYRRLVAEAEEKVGVSCGFYFSAPVPAAGRAWSADRWAEVLGAPPERRRPAVQRADLALVDVCEDGVYLQVSPQMYELALERKLALVGSVTGRRLVEIPLAQLGSQLTAISERVGRGIRKLPFDMSSFLEPGESVVRDLELAVVDPSQAGDPSFTRSIGTVGVLASGASATPDLMAELGADGQLEALTGGWLTGWFRFVEADQSLSVYVDGELAVRRTAELRRFDAAGEVEDGVKSFRFNVGRLVRLGGTPGGEVSVRVSGSNVPLRGAPFAVADVGKDLRYDADRDAWVDVDVSAPSAPRAPIAARLLRRARRS